MTRSSSEGARRVSLAATALTIHLISCATPRAPEIPAPPASDPAATFARFREREAAIRSLRALFVSTTVHEDVERTAQGVLLVRKPDRFRLRLILPFGVTLFDYLSVGEDVWTTSPLTDRESGDLAPFSRQDLGAAFLRGEDAFPGDCSMALDARGVAVTCRACTDCPIARTLLLQPGTGALLQEVGYGDGAPRMSLTYDVHREVDGRLLPFRIRLRDLARGAEVDIRVQSYEVNPELRDALFLPVPD